MRGGASSLARPKSCVLILSGAAGSYALDEVDRACHGAQVDAFGCGATLDVLDVAEGVPEEPPGALPVGPGQHPRMHDAAERGAVRGTRHVVVDVARDGLRVERVPHVFESAARISISPDQLCAFSRHSMPVRYVPG